MMPLLRILAAVTLAACGTAALSAQDESAQSKADT